jgi:hypothetical protein
MRVKKDIVLREIAGEYILVPTGESAVNMLRIMSLNDCGVFLWKLLAEEKTERELVDAVLEEYEIDAATAEQDVKEYLSQLAEADLLA